MLWVVAAIVAYVAFYTAVNLVFRKPAGSAHEPFAEAESKARRGFEPVGNEWLRCAVVVSPDNGPPSRTRSEEALRAPLPQPLDRAVPLDLALIMPGPPKLAVTPASVAVATPVAHTDRPRFELGFASSARPVRLGLVLAYARRGELHVFLQDESRHAPGEPPVTVTARALLEFPAEVLEPGEWRVSLYAADAVFTATVRVE